MKIGIDARVLERPTTGVGRYLSNILENILKLDSENEYILFSCRPLTRTFVAKNIKNIFSNNYPKNKLMQKFLSPFWLNIILPRYLAKEKIDVFFSPNNLLPICQTGTKNVVTIHDLFQFVDKKFHSSIYRWYSSFIVRCSIKRANHIFTVSESSKRDIIKFLKVPAEKITVTYPGCDQHFSQRELSAVEVEKLQNKYSLPPKFILYVGMIEGRKNIKGILEIGKILQEKESRLPIVLVGRLGFGGKKYLKQFKKSKNIYYCGSVTDEELPYFYNLASVFLFPSFYEGFGLPVLEAMQSGVPVLTSSTSSLPEVVGESVVLLESSNTQGFAEALVEILAHEEKCRIMIARGLAQAKKFSYETVVKLMLEVFV